MRKLITVLSILCITDAFIFSSTVFEHLQLWEKAIFSFCLGWIAGSIGDFIHCAISYFKDNTSTSNE